MPIIFCPRLISLTGDSSANPISKKQVCAYDAAFAAVLHLSLFFADRYLITFSSHSIHALPLRGSLGAQRVTLAREGRGDDELHALLAGRGQRGA